MWFRSVLVSCAAVALVQTCLAQDRFTTVCTPKGTILADNARFEPACLVTIYEDIGQNRRVVLFSPDDPQLLSRKLSVDHDSVLVIDPSRRFSENAGLALNSLFVRAAVVREAKSQNLEVIGYYEIGASEKDRDSQKAFMFSTFDDIAAAMSNVYFLNQDLVQTIWTGRTEEIPSKNLCWEGLKKPGVDLEEILAKYCPIPEPDRPAYEDLRERSRNMFDAFAPEALAVLDFLSSQQQGLIAREIANEVFEIDFASLRAIIGQIQEDIKLIRSGQLQEEERERVRRRLLTRLLLIGRDFAESRREVEGIAKAVREGGWPSSPACPDTRAKPGYTIAALQQNKNFEAAARQCYLEEAKATYAAKLRKYLVSGTINLRQNSVRPGETVRLTVLTARPGSDADGAKSEFDIRVTSYGWKPVLDTSLLFIRRIGVGKEEEKTTAPGGGLRNVRFAPYPGVTFGTTFFRRGLRDCTLKASGTQSKDSCVSPAPLAEFEKQRYYIQDHSGAGRFMHALAPGVGVNATFMTFNDLRDYNPSASRFENTNGSNFQLGVGPIFMLFNGKLSASFGWNLMADKRRIYYGLGFNFIESVKALKDVFPGTRQ